MKIKAAPRNKADHNHHHDDAYTCNIPCISLTQSSIYTTLPCIIHHSFTICHRLQKLLSPSRLIKVAPVAAATVESILVTIRGLLRDRLLMAVTTLLSLLIVRSYLSLWFPKFRGFFVLLIWSNSKIPASLIFVSQGLINFLFLFCQFYSYV